MLTSEIYENIIGFIRIALNDPRISIQQSYQSVNRPKKPFVSINIPNFRQYGFGSEREIDDQGIQEIIINETFTLSIEAFSDKRNEAEDIINKIFRRLKTLDAQYISSNLGYRRPLMNVFSRPIARGQEYESYATVDLEFGVRHVETQDAGIIETAVITNKMRNETFEVSK